MEACARVSIFLVSYAHNMLHGQMLDDPQLRITHKFIQQYVPQNNSHAEASKAC